MPCSKCFDVGNVSGSPGVLTGDTCTCSTALNDIFADIDRLTSLPSGITYRIIEQDIKVAKEDIDGIIDFFRTNTGFAMARADTEKSVKDGITLIKDVGDKIVTSIEDIVRQNEPLLIAIVITIILVVVLAVLIGLKILFVVPI